METETAVAIYQPGYAIFGVGKTERSAKTDAREWVRADERGKPDFTGVEAVPCTVGVYNAIRGNKIDSKGPGYTEVHDTRGNLLLVTDEEAALYNEFLNLGNVVVMK